MKIETRYLDGSYLEANPSWDRDDAAWKADLVIKMLSKWSINPLNICEVGCGSGDILRSLSTAFPASRLVGYDVSPQVSKFWKNDIEYSDKKIELVLGNFHEINADVFDLLLMLDVFEHIRDPFTFLEESRQHAIFFIFHIPLDLSAIGILRKSILLDVRKKVGHLHSYTKDLALETLSDSGYTILDWKYSGASLDRANPSFKTAIARIPRRLMGWISKDLAVRLFGGETLIVLAK